MSDNRLDQEWVREELIPFLARVWGKRQDCAIRYDWTEDVHRAEDQVNSIRDYDNSAYTVERLRQALYIPGVIYAHPGSQVYAVAQDIGLSIAIFVRYALTYGGYQLATLDHTWNPSVVQGAMELRKSVLGDSVPGSVGFGKSMQSTYSEKNRQLAVHARSGPAAVHSAQKRGGDWWSFVGTDQGGLGSFYPAYSSSAPPPGPAIGDFSGVLARFSPMLSLSQPRQVSWDIPDGSRYYGSYNGYSKSSHGPVHPRGCGKGSRWKNKASETAMGAQSRISSSWSAHHHHWAWPCMTSGPALPTSQAYYSITGTVGSYETQQGSMVPPYAAGRINASVSQRQGGHRSGQVNGSRPCAYSGMPGAHFNINRDISSPSTASSFHTASSVGSALRAEASEYVPKTGLRGTASEFHPSAKSRNKSIEK
ncbi:uncharacterized protein BDR25DRAFT_378998 [Lindgomyces ingoldianus]|uniref:Uncharacterized protein n=1 Tax=Lindgomyces ingoldianus TaxID=673940 RepID=A0ACB6QGV4_9PLEO|nr:uncharacterized protein BDR25DRAFT_378998 [Lindgomyces ingoldianus]KAF2465337.1 hypothetical protein BDR25DRAFT_378998 [Lindgomyces ingoldianus]